MSTSSPEAPTKSASPTMSKTSIKTAKPTKVIKLKLSSYLLTQFPYEDSETNPEPKPSKAKPSQPSVSETPKSSKTSTEEKGDKSNATPDLSTTLEDGDASTSKESKRKGVPGPKPGSKRSAPAPTPTATTEPDGTPKPKGKPGPKKRKVEGENGASAPAPAPKLGPKANQGAINAQLRALDRTGKPCRRWGKKGIQLKSFTGINWDLPYWQSPRLRRPDPSTDAQSQETSSSEAKNEPTSSQVASESNIDHQRNSGMHDTPDFKGAASFNGATQPASSNDAPVPNGAAGMQATEVASPA